MTETIRIATRKSPLAMWQAEHVSAELQRLHEGLTVEIVGMTTRGDKILDAPLAKVGGKGLFGVELFIKGDEVIFTRYRRGHTTPAWLLWCPSRCQNLPCTFGRSSACQSARFRFWGVLPRR